MCMMSFLWNRYFQFLKRQQVSLVSQPTKNLPSRISSNASQPITNRVDGAVDYGVHVIWHDDIADQFVRIFLPNLIKRTNEHFTRLVATKDLYSVECHKCDVVKRVSLV